MVYVRGRYEDTQNGYIKLYLSDGRVVEEHRFKMEKKLRRRLGYNEIVHHRNGDKHDNRLPNLELRDRAGHASQHHRETEFETLRCLCCGERFKREKTRIDYKRRHGQTEFFCSRSCMSKTYGRGRAKAQNR